MINKISKKTGIPTLDHCLGGGIPTCKTLLFYGPPLVESDAFLMQTVFNNLAEDEVCYYVSSSYSPDAVRSSFKDYGWDTSRYSKRFEIVDAYSSQVGASSGERFSVSDPESIESYDEAICAIINEQMTAGNILAISSLSALFDHCSCDNEEVLRYARKWNKMAVLNGGIVIYNFIDRGYGQEITDQVVHGLCNASVQVVGLGAERIYGHYFTLEVCDWGVKIPDRPTLFKVARPGGITVHIPKILVTGPQGSGKSRFVRTASTLSAGKYVSVDRMGTTVAGDHAQVTIKGFSVDLFGTPGQKRFIPMLKAFSEDAMGIVVVVDSADTASFECASKMLMRANMESVPYIIAANKRDAKGSLDPDEIRKRMAVPDDVPIMGICATKDDDVRRVLEMIIGMVINCSTSRPVEKFESVIEDLSRVSGVKATAIVSRGGLLNGAEMPGGVQGELLAFEASLMLIPAEMALDKLEQGKLDKLVVEVNEHNLTVATSSKDHILVVLAEGGERSGRVNVEIERAIRKIKEIAGEAHEVL
jgi:hypothetical protein